MLDELDNVDPSSYMDATHSALERELAALRNTLTVKTTVIEALEIQQNELKESVRAQKATNQELEDRISTLRAIDEEEKMEKMKARSSYQLRQSIKKETELEMELANIQIVNEQLDRANTKSRNRVKRIKRKGDKLEKEMESMIHQKVEMLQRANEQMDTMREFVKKSQNTGI